MPRTLSVDLQDILALPTRKIIITSQIDFPNNSSMYFSSEDYTDSKSQVFLNYLEKVSENKQTLENPTDRITLSFQNKDKALGLDLAANLSEWQEAQCIVGREYLNDDGSLTDWVETFRGAVQQPVVDDFMFVFTVISDVTSAGNIIANRTLAGPCAFLFKHPGTCGYSGGETTCNRLLKSPGGCLGRDWQHRYGGWTDPETPTPTSPHIIFEDPLGGTGGGDTCPTLDQFILIVHDGVIQTTQVMFLTEKSVIYDPVSRQAVKVKSCRVVGRQPIMEITTANGARLRASRSHKVIRSIFDKYGTPLEKLNETDFVLTSINNELYKIEAAKIESRGFTDVMKIELESPHIYAVGSSSEKLIVSHNIKPIWQDY